MSQDASAVTDPRRFVFAITCSRCHVSFLVFTRYRKKRLVLLTHARTKTCQKSGADVALQRFGIG